MFLLLASDYGALVWFSFLIFCFILYQLYSALQREMKRMCHGGMRLSGFLQRTSGRISGLYCWIIKYLLYCYLYQTAHTLFPLEMPQVLMLVIILK